MDRQETLELLRRIFREAGAGALSPSDIAFLFGHIEWLEKRMDEVDPNTETFWQALMRNKERRQR